MIHKEERGRQTAHSGVKCQIHSCLSGKPWRLFPDSEVFTSEDAFALSPPGGSQVLSHFQETKTFFQVQFEALISQKSPENVAHDPILNHIKTL